MTTAKTTLTHSVARVKTRAIPVGQHKDCDTEYTAWIAIDTWHGALFWLEAVPSHAASVPWQPSLHPFAWTTWSDTWMAVTLRACKNHCSSSGTRCWFTGCQLTSLHTRSTILRWKRWWNVSQPDRQLHGTG